MEDLQLVLFVLGAIAIVAVLVHGFWSIRKQQPRPIKERSRAQAYKEPPLRRDQQGFDVDGIGAVRVRKLSPEDARLSKGETSVPVMTLQKKSVAVSMPLDDTANHAVPTQGALFTEEVPVNTHTAAVNPETLQLDLGAQHGYSSKTESMPEPLSDYPKNTHRPLNTVHSQFNEPPMSPPPAAPVVEEKEQVLADPQDVLVLHVVAPEGQELQGAELLPCLLSLNFKFGDMDIFHRHQDNAGNGKVLFSMANMLKPGVFDPDKMEQFSTQGVVLFMTLPCHGDPLMNFSIMLNSAEQLADDLDGIVLDERRSPWTEHNKQDYLRRIKAVI